MESEFYKCPYCKDEKLGIYGGALAYFIREFYNYPDEYTRKELSCVLKNLIKYKKIKGSVDEFIKDIDNKRPKDNISDLYRDGEFIDNLLVGFAPLVPFAPKVGKLLLKK